MTTLPACRWTRSSARSGILRRPNQNQSLRPTSPARDQGTGSITVVDQRSFPRPVGAAADLGAYEAGTFANFAAWSAETAGTTLSATATTISTTRKSSRIRPAPERARRPCASSPQPCPRRSICFAHAHLFAFRYQSAARDLREHHPTQFLISPAWKTSRPSISAPGPTLATRGWCSHLRRKMISPSISFSILIPPPR